MAQSVVSPTLNRKTQPSGNQLT